MSIELADKNKEISAGQTVDMIVRYQGADPVPNDLHIDIREEGSTWRPLINWPLIPTEDIDQKPQNVRTGIKIGVPTPSAPGRYQYKVRWTHKRDVTPAEGALIGTDIIPNPITTVPPPPPTGSGSKSTKEKCLDDLGITIVFVFLTPIRIVNMLIAGIVLIGNEIAAASLNRQCPDADFASAAVPPTFALGRAETDFAQFSEITNRLLNVAVNLQLEYCAVVHTACVATNRFHSAVSEGDCESAILQLKDVQRRFSQARLLQYSVSESLRDLANSIAGTECDREVEREEIIAFQLELLRNQRFSGQLDAGLRGVLEKFDRQLTRIFNPYELSRRLALGVRSANVPIRLSDALLREADAFLNLDKVIGPFPGVHQLVPTALSANADLTLGRCLKLE